jgi:hypothetical protein
LDRLQVRKVAGPRLPRDAGLESALNRIACKVVRAGVLLDFKKCLSLAKPNAG